MDESVKEKIKVLYDGSNMPEVRGMTRRQAREFNEKGFNPLRNKSFVTTQKDSESATVDDALIVVTLNDNMNEWILENVYPEYDFDDADKAASDILAAKTYRKTFLPAKEEIKNS